ncbi:hypothetical protein [Thalassoroseus pseudoceratinae]|uniref:hypothetical protein n=1 Tax=Thalassoroseus pseudoceratinae TaxID=2713176 RepID=UPI00141DA472|nr:hypothetical protein [Thalassoroseus pseudoceratinae]
MTKPNRFAIRLPLEDRGQLGPVRTLSGLTVCVVDEWLWLRLDSTEMPVSLRSLRRGEVFSVLDDGGLVPWGRQVPDGYLPDGPWQPLATHWDIEWPIAAIPAAIPNRVVPQLVRSETVREPNVLQTHLTAWMAYALTAPQIRLDRWHFVVSREDTDENGPLVLVRGTPLPPIPGTQFVEEDGIAVPCGWHWSPAVDTDVLMQAFGVAPPDFILWTPDGRFEHIAAEDFVRATRSAVRRSVSESPTIPKDERPA